MFRSFAHAALAASAAALVLTGPARADIKKPSGSAVHLQMPAQHRVSPAGGVTKAPPAGANVWASRCVAVARTEVPDCSVEQRVVLKETGQVLAAATVSLPHGSNKPTILVQVPLGIALDKGVVLKLDNRGPVTLRLQTCEQSGCYAASVMAGDFLAGMLSAKKLELHFVGVNGRPVTVPMPLDGFAAAYNRIK